LHRILTNLAVIERRRKENAKRMLIPGPTANAAPSSVRASANGPRIRRDTRIPRAAVPWVLVSPIILLIAGFVAIPLLSVFWNSLFKKNLTKPWSNGFVGLDNFHKLLFGDPLFWESLGFTVKWVAIQLVFQLVIGLVLALIVNEAFKGRGVVRSIVFSPWAISGVLTTAIWLLVYNPGTGVFRLLGDLGVGDGNTALLASPATVVGAAAVAELWRGVPFFAIMLLADLQSAPKDLYEAASIDGAGRYQRFRYVTLPHLKNAIVLTTLLRGVWEFNNVDLLYTMTNGGPVNMTTTLPLYVAKMATVSHELGYGSAATVLAFVILLGLSIVYLKLTNFGKGHA
jgi:multiple sugar transport system permease protein